MKIDIICPVYKNFDQFENLYSSFQHQKDVEIVNVICPLTETEDDQKIINFFNENGIKYFKVTKEEFSHYKTREKAVREFASERCVVFMSQDVKLENEYALVNLCKPIDSREAAYSYGRQIVEKKCIEKYIREKNYPTTSNVVTNQDIDRLQIMAFFASDAFSCIDRDIFIALGGYQGHDYKMNEDQIYSYIVLTNGYKKKYCADAIVEHYHKYTLKKLYNRYFQAGRFYKGTKVLNKYQMTSSGSKLAKYVLKRSFQNFDIVSLIKFVPNMAARYLGMKKGKK